MTNYGCGDLRCTGHFCGKVTVIFRFTVKIRPSLVSRGVAVLPMNGFPREVALVFILSVGHNVERKGRFSPTNMAYV